MTVYKAFRNFIIALAIVALIVTGSLIGFSAYKIYDYTQNSQYVVSKLGSSFPLSVFTAVRSTAFTEIILKAQ